MPPQLSLCACAAIADTMFGGFGHVAAHQAYPLALPNAPAFTVVTEAAVMTASGLLVAAFTASTLLVMHGHQKKA